MKICPSCQDYSLYDDTLEVCPHCGTNLEPYERQNVPNMALATEKDDGLEQFELSGGSLPSDSVVHPAESIPVEEKMPPTFVHNEGNSLVFRGTVSEVKSVALNSTWLKKAIRVFTSGEPFQIGNPYQYAVIRLEQFHTDSVAAQKMNVVFYGSVDGYLTVGDDITVYADEMRGRYVAKQIYSNETESEIPNDPVIPAPAFMLMVALPICLLFLGAGYAVYMGVTRWWFKVLTFLTAALLITMGVGAIIRMLKKTGRKIIFALKSALILFLFLLLVILFLITR